ncbi:uncharacterized protein FFB14_07252 [Fusarium fujikuroi]|nr:uncharacterized protein FFB14_07252 [Fusarium fujikuroi]
MIPRLNCQSGSGSELKSAPSCLVLFNRFGTENGQSLGHAPGRSNPGQPGFGFYSNQHLPFTVLSAAGEALIAQPGA